MAAVALRMVLAAALCWLILTAMRKPLIQERKDWNALFAGAFGLFPNMLLVYWSAQFIPSGLIAVILGIYPFFVGVFSWLILKDNPFNYSRIFALLVAIIGLIVIHHAQLDLGEDAFYGVLGILISSVFFAFGTVWLKAVGGGIDPMRQLTGSLTLCAPMFALTWWVFDGEIPSEIHWKSWVGISYLVVAGSLFGGVMFYFVLKKCSVGTVSLITLITPMAAIYVGYFLEGEVLTVSAVIGCGLILISLALYQGVIMNVLKLVLPRIKKIKFVVYAPITSPNYQRNYERDL